MACQRNVRMRNITVYKNSSKAAPRISEGQHCLHALKHYSLTLDPHVLLFVLLFLQILLACYGEHTNKQNQSAKKNTQLNTTQQKT